MDPALWELTEGDEEEEIEALVRLRPGGVAPEQVRIVSRFGSVATCRMRRGSILDVRANENVESLKAPRVVAAEIHSSPPGVETAWAPAGSDIGPTDHRRTEDLPWTGRGTVVGVVDWGVDFACPSFREADGRTRFLAIWDQRGKVPSSAGNKYGRGRIFHQEEIDRALTATDPYQALGYHPGDFDFGDGTHGTHVLDIAAGAGRHGGAMGMAPEAELVFVHLATHGTGGLANLGDSVSLVEAVDFIFEIAAGRPCSINLSVGRHAGCHDGKSLVEQAFDAALIEAPGRAIINSTGNYYGARIHASGELALGAERTLRVEVQEADATPNEIELWYPGTDEFGLAVRAAGNAGRYQVDLGDDTPIQVNGHAVGHIYHRRSDPNNGAHLINVFLYRGAPAGTWEIHIVGRDVADGRYHAWIERDAGYRTQARFHPDDSDESSTTGTICNGLRTIAVGAYDAHASQRPLASFSSAGRTRDGREKPNLVAPGVDVLAARSTSHGARPGDGGLVRKSGTSMAAPHVTGAVAVMFEAAQRPLEIAETRRLLLTNTDCTALPEGESARIGRGYLDTVAAATAAANVDEIAPPAPEPRPVATEPSRLDAPEVADEPADELADAEARQDRRSDRRRVDSRPTLPRKPPPRPRVASSPGRAPAPGPRRSVSPAPTPARTTSSRGLAPVVAVAAAQPAPAPEPEPTSPEPGPGTGAEPEPGMGVAPEPAPGTAVEPEPAPGTAVEPEPAPGVGAAPEPAPGTGGEPAPPAEPPSTPPAVETPWRAPRAIETHWRAPRAIESHQHAPSGWHESWDVEDATGNALFYPATPGRPRVEPLAALQGGLVTDASLRARVSVIVGPGATPRGIARRVLPIFADVATRQQPAPSVDELAQALMVYSQYYLPVPSMDRFQDGLRVPLPIEIDRNDGAWVINPRIIRLWAGSFDPAWQQLLDRRAARLPTPDPEAVEGDAQSFLQAQTTPLARGVHLMARVMSNPFEVVLLFHAVMRRLGAGAFDVALAFLDQSVRHQIELMASLTAGRAILRRLQSVLAQPPATLGAAASESLERARRMLRGALEDRSITARELPMTERQIANRPGTVRGRGATDPAAGLHRMVLGRDVAVGTMGDFTDRSGRVFRGCSFVGRLDPVAFVRAHAAEINPTGDARLSARLRIVGAIAINEGLLDAVRMRDRGILSIGMQQWSAHVELELPALLWRYKQLAADEFDLFFGLHGLDVRSGGVDGHGNPLYRLRRVLADGTAVSLDTWPLLRDFFGGRAAGQTTTFDPAWGARARFAVLASKSFRIAQIQESAARLDRLLRDVPSIRVDGRSVPLNRLITSELGVALLLDAHINRPSSVRDDLQAAADAVGARPTANGLEQAIVADYATRRHTHDTPTRTNNIRRQGLDVRHGSFTGW